MMIAHSLCHYSADTRDVIPDFTPCLSVMMTIMKVCKTTVTSCLLA